MQTSASRVPKFLRPPQAHCSILFLAHIVSLSSWAQPDPCVCREVQELKEMIYECGQCVDVKPWTIEPEYAPSKIGTNRLLFNQATVRIDVRN